MQDLFEHTTISEQAYIIDNEINVLRKQEHSLIRQFDRHEIEEDEYNIKLEALTDKINEKIKYHVDKNDEQLRKEEEEKQNKKVETQEVNEKMADEEVKKEDKPLSYTKLIIKALSIKGIKNINDTVTKVLEWKPGRDAKKVKTQMKSIIYLVKTKKGAKRWNNYDWDEEQFLLTSKDDS